MSETSAIDIFHLVTLGCKVNQYEAQSLREAWLNKGWRETRDPGKAGVILVNTCAVTANAVSDVRAVVRRLNRAAPLPAIVLTRCAAQALPGELRTLPGVAQVVGQSDKHILLDSPLPIHAPVREMELNAFPPFAIASYDRSRAVLKVQDGCSHSCTYCIVPLTRGSARSRPFEEILAEARRLLEAGFAEIILSGVNLRQFILTKPGSKKSGDFWDLLAGLDAALMPAWQGKARLRISSLEPGQLGTKALEILASCHLVTPHLHLSLQSGSPSVLRRMGRGHYDPAALTPFLRDLTALWPVFGLGADILTGFPGETGNEFLETLALCRSLPLTYAHVFPYSARPGTKAVAMNGQVEVEEKKKRASMLRQLVADKKKNFARTLLKCSQLEVVFEARDDRKIRPSSSQGLCEYYLECRTTPDAAVIPRVLTPVLPLDLKKGVLLVSPLSGDML